MFSSEASCGAALPESSFDEGGAGSIEVYVLASNSLSKKNLRKVKAAAY